MLTPEELGALPNSVVSIYQELEDFIIKDIARRINKAGKITDTAKWQLERATEFGMAKETLEKKIAEILNKSQKEIEKLFTEAATLSTERDAVLYEQAKLTPLHLSTSEELKAFVDAAIVQTKGELRNITRSLGFVSKGANGKLINKQLTKFYQDILDFTQFQIASGVADYQTSIRNAIKQISQSGVRVINYESGWVNRLDVAVRRASLTGVNQMNGNMTNFSIKELGAEYVEVTAHAGARVGGNTPYSDHSKWQGKVYRLKGSEPGYPNFAESTGYGLDGSGLLGWNCRHSFYPFFPGISERAYTDKELENIEPKPFSYKGREYTYYEATQRQRLIERNIRATKRELIGYDAVGDKEAFTQASIKLQQQKKEYNDFSKAAGIRKKNDRQQVIGFDKSKAQKAVWANKKKVR